MKQYTIYQIDSFTRSRFKGNPAGVVIDADGLSENQMQKIARELNNSETAFLFRPGDSNCDCEIRYFTPTIEVPTCGHASIAAIYAKAIEEQLDSCILNVKTKIGVLPFEINKSDGQIKIWMTQGNIEIEPPLPQNLQNRLLDYLGISKKNLDERCPIQIASTGHSKVMIGITERKTLNHLTPDMHQLKQLSKEINCNGYFVCFCCSRLSLILLLASSVIADRKIGLQQLRIIIHVGSIKPPKLSWIPKEYITGNLD